MTIDDNITSLQQAKMAFAKENNLEPCTNDKCGFSGCTCGKKCGCNVVTTSEMLETCDPCAEFKRKKEAANACKAREA